MVGNPMPGGRIKAVGPDLHDVSHIADEGSFHRCYGNPLTFPGFDFQTSNGILGQYGNGPVVGVRPSPLLIGVV